MSQVGKVAEDHASHSLTVTRVRQWTRIGTSAAKEKMESTSEVLKWSNSRF
jgi:hypothetical protein